MNPVRAEVGVVLSSDINDLVDEIDYGGRGAVLAGDVEGGCP